MSTPIRLIGAPGSPYSRKMIGLLRYRRIPYALTWGDPSTILDEMAITDKPKPIFLPTFLFTDNDSTVAQCDSTPIIRQLEQSHPERSVIPNNPTLAFINYLLEDYGDEWCTKFMFHYRWHFAPDADNAGSLLPLPADITLDENTRLQFKEYFSERQISRLGFVGSNEQTAPIIDQSYRRFLSLLEAHFRQQPYLLGKRPGSGDYAIYGQLTQLVDFDPTPAKIAREISPRTVTWTSIMEDQSGLEPTDDDWLSVEQLPTTLKDILAEIGRTYVPALLANAKALMAGEKEWETEIDGALWKQQSFPYQGKCLKWINEEYQALPDADKASVNTLLAGTGCEQLLLKN